MLSVKVDWGPCIATLLPCLATRVNFDHPVTPEITRLWSSLLDSSERLTDSIDIAPSSLHPTHVDSGEEDKAAAGATCRQREMKLSCMNDQPANFFLT